MDSEVDIVVVGSGIAGLSCAVEAAQAGASVLLAESEGILGGSSRLSSGVVMAAGSRYQRAAGIADSAEALFTHYLALNQWKVEPGVVWAIAENSAASVEWLGDLGVNFSPQIYFSGDEDAPRGHSALGAAQEIVDVLAAAARANGVNIALGRRVDRLLTSDGAVTGVAVGDDELPAPAVVLATGGFGANRELLARHFPTGASGAGDWLWYVGADSARGDAFDLVSPLGAQIAGYDRGQMVVHPHFPHSTHGYLPGWLVVVDAYGRRVFNEMAPYSLLDPLIRAADGPVFAIFDDAAKRAATRAAMSKALKVELPHMEGADWVEDMIDEMAAAGVVLTAGSLAELAAAMNVPAAQLEGSVARYNEMVEAGLDLDYRKPANYMVPISAPPFYATEIRLCQLSLTAVGPRVDARARVIDENSRPIAGLYAAGEVTGGVIGDVYVGSGNSLANCLNMGRVAGRESAKFARR